MMKNRSRTFALWRLIPVVISVIVVTTAVQPTTNPKTTSLEVNTPPKYETQTLHTVVIITEVGWTQFTTAMLDYEDVKTTAGVPGARKWEWRFTWTWWTILQLTFSVVGVLSNLLVIMAFVRRGSTTHSTDIFIGALAFADLLTSLFFIPLPRASKIPATPWGKVYCVVMFGYYYRWVCVVASTYILVAMSIERLVAVAHPFRFKRIFTKRLVYIIVLVAWLIGLASSGYFVTFEPSPRNCAPGFSLDGILIVQSVNFAVRLAVPVTTMIVTQVMTAVVLHRQGKKMKKTVNTIRDVDPKQFYHRTARDRVVVIMFIMVIIFVAAWTPSSVAWLLVAVGILPPSYPETTLHWVLLLVTYANCSANPFIYAARFPKFRKAIREIFTGVEEKNKPLFGIPSGRGTV